MNPVPPPVFQTLTLLGHGLMLAGTLADGLRPLVPAGGVLAFAGLALAMRSRRGSLRFVLATAIALRLLLLPAPPTLSDDVYRYLWDGQLAVDGMNPFAHRPSSPALAGYQEGVLFERMNSPDYYSVYPPVLQGAFFIAALALPLGFDPAYYLLKLLFGVAELVALLVLARLTTTRRLLLYAWNPLVILETWGQPHGEAAVTAALTVALAAAIGKRTGPAAGALALATWTKLWPVLLVPFFALKSGRTGRFVLIFIAVSAIGWAPFLLPNPFPHLLESLRLYTKSFEWNAGPYYAVKEISTHAGRALGIMGPTDETSKLVGPVMRWIFLGAVALLFLLGRCRPLVQITAWILGLFVALLATVHPWYLVPIFALVPLFRPIDWAWVPLAIGSMGTYLFYTHDLYWPFVILGWGGWAAIYFQRAWRRHLTPFARPLPSVSP